MKKKYGFERERSMRYSTLKRTQKTLTREKLLGERSLRCSLILNWHYAQEKKHAFKLL